VRLGAIDARAKAEDPVDDGDDVALRRIRFSRLSRSVVSKGSATASTRPLESRPTGITTWRRAKGRESVFATRSLSIFRGSIFR
jgi:hypothetical protein